MEPILISIIELRLPWKGSKAVNNVNTIIDPALIGKNPSEQTAIDNYIV